MTYKCKMQNKYSNSTINTGNIIIMEAKLKV